MGEFPIGFVGKGIEETGWDWTIENQVTLEQVYSLYSFKATRLACRRFASADIRTFVEGGMICVRPIGVIFNIWILIELRTMRVIIGAIKVSVMSREELRNRITWKGGVL